MRKNRSLSYRIFLVCTTIFMILIAIIMTFPYLNTLAKALNEGIDTARGGIVLWPRVLTLDNFKVILNDSGFWLAGLISVLRVVIGVLLSLIVQFAAAYALSKKDLPYKNIVVAFFTVQMFVGAGAIPTYVLYSKMHLLNSFWVYILPSLMSFYNVVIIRTFIQTTIPDSLYESAYIDGATDVTVFARIVIPLSKPVLATMALWTMVNHWNDWTTTLTYIRNPKLYTLQYKMMQLIKESDRMQSIIEAARVSGQIVEETSLPTSDGLIAAQVILSTLPIVCAYPFLQKYFVKGITIGAVKG